MANINKFTEAVVKKLEHYVYRLIDPRTGITFYIGRGQGNRVFAHAYDADKETDNEKVDSLKLRNIRAIRSAGFEVQHVIHRHGMDEKAAKEVEAALIDAYPGLTNIQGGHDGTRGVMHADQIVRIYESPEAEFKHNLLLIKINKSYEDRGMYDAVRCCWNVKPDIARKVDNVLAVLNGLIVGVFVADEWLPATEVNFPSLPIVEGRYGFRGRKILNGAVRDNYLNKRIPQEYNKKGAANPIRYVWAKKMH